MSSYKRKEVFDYLIRKPVAPQEIELAKSRYQLPATSIEQPETDYQTEVQPDMVVPPQDVLPKNPEPVMPSAPGIPNPQDRILELATGGRAEFKDGNLAISNIIKNKNITETQYNKLADYIKNTFKINKDDPNLFPAIEKYSERFKGNISRTAESLGIDRTAMVRAGQRRNYELEAKGWQLKGKDYPLFKPLSEKQKEIIKKVYGVKESEIDNWQTDPKNKIKKSRVMSGEITLDTKPHISGPNRIIVSMSRGSNKINDVIFPNKTMEKDFLKDVEEKLRSAKGQSEKDITYFTEKYPINKVQAQRAINYIKNDLNLEYPEGSTKIDLANKLKETKQKISDVGTELYITGKIKKPILKEQNLEKKIDLAHRISKEHMKYLGLQFDTRTTGFDSRLINQVIIRPSEIALEKLYSNQRKVIDNIKENGVTEELSTKLEDLNNKIRTEAKKTNGRLIAVTVDPETLDISFEGKKAKFGLTDKVLDIKEIAEMPIDKRVKFLTNQITPRIQAEIDRGFTPNDFKEILSDSNKQKSILKYADTYAPELKKDLKQIFKNPTSTKSLPLYTDPTGIGNVLETALGQTLSKTAPNLLKAVSKLSTATGTPFNALLGVALNAEENKEKGLSDLETIAAGAYKGTTQDLLNFGDLIFRKLPIATYEKFVENKPFLESLLNKPEYFEFADRQIDKYASEKSIKDRIENRAEYEARKSIPINTSETEVPTTMTSGEFNNLIQIKKDEILNSNPQLKNLYEKETATVPEQKTVPQQRLMLGPIVFPEQTQEFAIGGRAKFAKGSEDDLYIPPLNKSEEQFKEGIFNIKRSKPSDGIIGLATEGRVGFQVGGGANFLKMLRNISDSIRELKNSTHMLGSTAKSQGVAKAAEEALAPYAGGFKGNQHETLIQKIQNAKEHLPKEYHGVLDEMRSYADKHAYDAVDDMAKALDKIIDPNLKFENLPKNMFPIEDPLNNAFIIIDPEKGYMTGRYVNRVRIDPETGRGTRETFDTFDSKTRTFLKEEDWKPVGVESIEKGKEGLN